MMEYIIIQDNRVISRVQNWETDDIFIYTKIVLSFLAVLAFIGSGTIVWSLSNREKRGGDGTFNEAGIIKRGLRRDSFHLIRRRRRGETVRGKDNCCCSVVTPMEETFNHGYIGVSIPILLLIVFPRCLSTAPSRQTFHQFINSFR